MRYLSFEVRNFRGIKHAKIDLIPSGGGVFTLIGLNESGKTTVLEAINSFNSEPADEKSLYQTSPTDEDPSTFVPKHEKYNFSGDITVEAVVEFEGDERERAIAYVESQTTWKLDRESVPTRFKMRRGYKFENSDKTRNINIWYVNLKGKDKGGKKLREINTTDAPWQKFLSFVRPLTPEIVYFPTFIFDQPDRIVLNPKDDEGPVDKLYRKIIENVGASLPKPIDIKTHIVDRVLSKDGPASPFSAFLSISDNKQQQIESAIDQLSSHLTETVFDSWSKVFGQTFADREVRLRLGADKFDDGTTRVSIQIGLKDGKHQYSLSERSLGFRWFFSFLLFTLFRSKEGASRRTVFLLDEPAANLHSSAQTQLMDSFPKIVAGRNTLIYSTHSHYMINPEWLDQSFIVSNKAVDYDDVSGYGAATAHTDIGIQKYRTFVGSNPDKVTYFQPVLDKLQIIPSRIDTIQPTVLVEGKGDYLLLQYGLFLCEIHDRPYTITPTRGADGFAEIVGIFLGWGVKFSICFDDDPKGRSSREEFIKNWSLPASQSFTLIDVSTDLKGKSIEGFLSPSDHLMIQDHYGSTKKPTKSQIQLFFSEALANKKTFALSDDFRSRIVIFDKLVKASLDPLS